MKKSKYNAIKNAGAGVKEALKDEGAKTRKAVGGKGSKGTKGKKGLGGKFPTLGDMRKKVPKGGLLNPGLRKGFGDKLKF